MRPLPQIMVAPNGARLGKADHPNIPLSIDEIVTCAADCHAVGAGALHAHLRDDAGAHVLDADLYRTLCEEMRRTLPDMAVQITTEAAGHYDVDHQMEVALAAGADMVSASVQEIGRAGQESARAFYDTCRGRGIAVQHILYDLADCDLLAGTLGPDELNDPALQMLFVLGRYDPSGVASPAALQPFLDWLQKDRLRPDWAVCAFGRMETECLIAAAKAGGKCRVGFENSLLLADGTPARSNAEKVSDLNAALGQAGVTAGQQAA